MAITILQILLLVYLGLVSIYLLVFSVAAFFYKPKIVNKPLTYKRFLLMIPAYKEDIVILSVAEEVLKQDYPKELFDVYVIADQLKPETIEKLRAIPVNVLEVRFEVSTKAKSINECIKMAGDGYDAVIILDADNLLDPDFISRSNELLNEGSYAIQGHRVAKNTDAHFSILDAISEEINNSVFRKGHVALGLSSALIGSGMTVEYNLYRKIMEQADTFAEDKELEFKLILQKLPIKYLDDVYIYDEKVSKPAVFVKQRSRWMAFQLIYAKRFIFEAFYEWIRHSNFDFFDKAIQQILLPRIILLGVTTIILLFSLIFNTGILFYAWIVQASFTYLAILLAIPKQFYNKQTFKALLSLPLAFVLMIKSLFRYEEAKKNFEPTPHTDTTVTRSKTYSKHKK